MSQIRKRSLKAATWIYFGFLVGAFNTYLFTHENWFNPTQYGLTRSLLGISLLAAAFSTLGVTSFIVKFFPYYADSLEKKKNDLLAVAFYIAAIGFVVTSITLLVAQPLVIKKLGTNSPMLVEYFYYVIPFAFFILLYNILEAYSYGFEKGVLTSLLKETVLRVYTTILLVLKIFEIISFNQFMLLFSLQYAIIVALLLFHLRQQGQLWFSLRLSKTTAKYRKKIIAIISFTFIVIVVNVLRSMIDDLVLAAKQDLSKVAIFGFSAYLVSVMQAPFRSLVAITLPILSRAWKDKKTAEINRIYHRSSINLLSFSLFIFFCIWLNYSNAINYFGINEAYLQGRWVFFILGLVTIIEMGTGVNGQIIGTSTFWRFELWTSLLLTAMIIPLSYFLTVKYGIMGPAFANLISFSIYNSVRIGFLWKKYRMQPFSLKTVEIILIALLAYFTTYYLFLQKSGLLTMILSSALYAFLFGFFMYLRNISPDLKILTANLKKRIS